MSDKHTDSYSNLQERIVAAIQSERVEDTGTDGDTAYNSAIEHCIAAVNKEFSASEGQAQTSAVPFDFHAHLARQAAWSGQTFGPGPRTLGVCDHIRKELIEIEADPLDLKEWLDVVILALDGAWRCGGTPEQIIDGIVAKQTKNEGRVWPDWRTMDPNKAIEHDRSHDAAQLADSTAPGAPEGWKQVSHHVSPGGPMMATITTVFKRGAYMLTYEGGMGGESWKLDGPAAPTAQQLSNDRPAGWAPQDEAEVERAVKLVSDQCWPTAQQSLTPPSKEWCEKMAQREIESGCNIEAGAVQQSTAGGAVPEYRVGWFWSSANPGKQVRCLAEGKEIAEYEKRGDFTGWCDAAAPLPQVQSALWAKFSDKLPPDHSGFFWRDGKEYGVGYFMAEDTADWHGEWLAVPDQQPVTPSGALADNDGGVA